MRNSDYYWLLIKKSKVQTHIEGDWKWQRDLQSHATEIDSFFSSVKYLSSDNKLREFYFKLLHRIVVTKRELHSFGLVNDTLCIYCRENDSIIHTFCNCHWSKEFYSEVIKWFNAENVASLSLSPTEILFGKAPFKTDPIIRELNCTLLFAKYYLYTQILAQNKISLEEFKVKCYSKFHPEKLLQ